MIGIDLVNLNDPLLKKRDERALKFITNTEDIYPEGELKFWWLWAAKEAVFKAQRIPNRNFAPKEIPIQITEKNHKLTFNSSGFSGEIFHLDHIIIAICRKPEIDLMWKFKAENSSNLSAKVRVFLLEELLQNGQDNIEIGTDHTGLPAVLPHLLPAAFSHHAGYIAFAYPKNFQLH